MDVSSENGKKTLYSLSQTNLINIIAYGNRLGIGEYFLFKDFPYVRRVAKNNLENYR